ncbi:hypothetical protein EB796_021808 [Bugula neritina]|uniref:Uncharacterized protein n=1 Tax=Bugula neritina TaxID=10212 RepID=A0A7J7J2H5_BUGNE|nr:hypothetical protein EB796_021808 [Bugula neritina]
MRNSTSLESINLLRLLMDEYIMVAIESQIQERTTQELVTELQQFLTPSSIANSSNSSGLGACLSYQHNMAHTHMQDNAIPINNEMRLRPIPFQQVSTGLDVPQHSDVALFTCTLFSMKSC